MLGLGMSLANLAMWCIAGVLLAVMLLFLLL
jgi:hypothetical protein